MKNYSEILAKNINTYRKQKGYTQEALADKLGITFQAVSKWENGQSSPDILLLPQLAEFLGVSIDKLFDIQSDSQKQEIHHDTAPELPWPDDKTLRAVVFLGHKIINNCDNISKFTFKLEGQPLNVISYCNIECKGNIQGFAKAEHGINCGNIYGDTDAGCGINCGNVGKSVSAGCGVNCGNVGGYVNAGQNVNCGDVSGSVECQKLKCKKIYGDVNCQGDIYYK